MTTNVSGNNGVNNNQYTKPNNPDSSSTGHDAQLKAIYQQSLDHLVETTALQERSTHAKAIARAM